MTAVTSAVLFCSECKGSGFHANERPYPYLTWAFSEPSVVGGGHEGGAHYNFVVIVPMIMKFGTGIKLDVFYTVVTKTFVTSHLLSNYGVITCILAGA